MFNSGNDNEGTSPRNVGIGHIEESVPSCTLNDCVRYVMTGSGPEVKTVRGGAGSGRF